MKKKILIFSSVVVLFLVLVLLGIGLKGCSDTTEETQKPDNEAVDDTFTDWADDDAINWEDATEDENVTNDVKDKSTDNAIENTVDGNVIEDGYSDSEQSNGELSSDNKASETKKQYMIKYILNNENATLETTTQKVTYGEAFTLAMPEVTPGSELQFVKWIITGTKTEFNNGIYTIEGDVSLTAVWEDTYTKNY